MVEQEYVDDKPAESAVAREFDGYNVKPQVYSTYAQEGDSHQPPPQAQRGYRDQYPHEHNESYDNRDYGYPDRNPPPPDYFPPERDSFDDRFENRSSFPERRNWEGARDFNEHGRYHDAEYHPPGGKYPVDDPPQRFPPEPPFKREGYPPTEPLSVRDRKYSAFPSGPPVPERPYPEEEYRRPIPVRDKYSYGGHELPPREGDFVVYDYYRRLGFDCKYLSNTNLRGFKRLTIN